MKSLDTELKKYAEKINLKVSERHELRERILSYMEYHPLKKQVSLKEELKQAFPSESFITLHLNSFYVRIAGGVVVLLLIAAPFAAEKSVPGDALYFVKTGVTETIQGQFANSPYEKIEFETKLMERRIFEALALASEKKLTEDVKTHIAETVKSHTQAVQDGLEELRTQDVDGAAIAEISFNASLEVQSAVLGVEESSDNNSLIDSILTVVNDARDVVVTNQENTTPSFEGLIASVETETTRAYELFTSIKESATDGEIRDIKRRLSDIDRLILEAKESYKDAVNTSVDDLVSTLGLLQKLIVFMTDINVRETVSLESLVPVVLSDEERVVLVEKESQSIEILATTIAMRLETLTEGGMTEKATYGLAQISDFIIAIGEALKAPDIEGAETLVKEARGLISDLGILTQPVVENGTPVMEGSEVEEGTGTSTSTGGTTTPVVSIELEEAVDA